MTSILSMVYHLRYRDYIRKVSNFGVLHLHKCNVTIRKDSFKLSVFCTKEIMHNLIFFLIRKCIYIYIDYMEMFMIFTILACSL